MFALRCVALAIFALLLTPFLKADAILFMDSYGVGSETIPAYYFDFSGCLPGQPGAPSTPLGSCQPFEGYQFTVAANTIPGTVYIGDPAGQVSDKIVTTISPPGPYTWSCTSGGITLNPCPGVTGVNFVFSYGLDLMGSPTTCASVGGCDFMYDGSIQTVGAITWGPGAFTPASGFTTTLQFQSLTGTLQTATLTNFLGGSSSDPVLLPSGQPVGQVTGSIGSFGSQDYYSFLWNGGVFNATASITGATNAGASYLFSEGVAGNCNSGGTATLNGSDSFTGTIAIANLAPGQYCIGLDATSPNDPAFALTFNTPVTGTTPEPSTLVFLAVGLGTIGVLRRITLPR